MDNQEFNAAVNDEVCLHIGRVELARITAQVRGNALASDLAKSEARCDDLEAKVAALSEPAADPPA